MYQKGVIKTFAATKTAIPESILQFIQIYVTNINGSKIYQIKDVYIHFFVRLVVLEAYKKCTKMSIFKLPGRIDIYEIKRS